VAEREDTDKIGFIMSKGWKRNECRSILFGIGAKEKNILVDHTEDTGFLDFSEIGSISVLR
jgi:hypothetical protein